jgi:hypothetical protein
MLKLDDTLYFSSISYNYYHDSIWQDIYDSCGYDGKTFINISRRINPCRFITRNGEWSLPWKQELIPGFEMPAYDAGYSKTFTEVTDEKCMRIAVDIRAGKKFAVFYSGGLDSTVIMAGFIKNLSAEELKSVVVCASTETIIENPNFWHKYIHGKLKVVDSNKIKYDDLIEQGYTPITADEGDCMFGTLFGLTLYNNFDYYVSDLSADSKANLQNIKYKISDPDVHYSEYADLIIRHLGIAADPNFGKLLYEKYDRNIKTATVPVRSLHDFFWWLIFNMKYLNCSVRGALYFNDRVEWKQAIYSVMNWYNDPEYQLWSMANNNNGQKIEKTLATYKMAARNYIYDLDHNEWYKTFKVKLESLWNITIQQDVTNVVNDLRPVHRVGLTKDWQMLYMSDKSVQDFYRHHLQNYKIDWR